MTTYLVSALVFVLLALLTWAAVWFLQRGDDR
jgi:hypothetical protein